MKATKIVTALVIISMNVGCKARFHSVNKQDARPTAGATAGGARAVDESPEGPTVPTGGPGKGTPPPPPIDTKNPPQPIGKDSPPPPPPRHDSCSTGDDNSLDPARRILRQTVKFKRGRQWVQHQNCDGKVLSEKFETLDGNNVKAVFIKPESSGTLSVFNRTQCHATSKQHAISRGGSGEYRFFVSTRKSDYAMWVKVGENYIDYEVGGEKGTLILTVVIDETESDCTVIRPSNCPN